MRSEGSESKALRRNVGLAVREIRRHRGATATQIAKAMGMPLRSYQYFEAGRGAKLDTDSIFRFAKATQSDADAILMAGMMGAPAFAAHAADNKLMSVLTITLQDFETRAGDAIRALRGAAIISSFRVLFDDLATQAQSTYHELDDWLAPYREKHKGPPPDQAP